MKEVDENRTGGLRLLLNLAEFVIVNMVDVKAGPLVSKCWKQLVLLFQLVD